MPGKAEKVYSAKEVSLGYASTMPDLSDPHQGKDTLFKNSVKYVIEQGVEKEEALILTIGIIRAQVGSRTIKKVGYYTKTKESKEDYNRLIEIYKESLKEHSPIKAAFLTNSRLINIGYFRNRNIQAAARYNKLEELLRDL